MGDMGEAFKGMREAGLKRKATNLANSTKILEESGVEFVSRNSGIQLIITGHEAKLDFWPSTGKFRSRDGHEGRGVYNMLRLCDVKEET